MLAACRLSAKLVPTFAEGVPHGQREKHVSMKINKRLIK
jgi:hypothetical protein